jgi:hypothetical protein
MPSAVRLVSSACSSNGFPPVSSRQASWNAADGPYYAPAAHLKVVVIPDTGHALALSTTAPLTDAVMIGWSLSVIAR